MPEENVIDQNSGSSGDNNSPDPNANADGSQTAPKDGSGAADGSNDGNAGNEGNEGNDPVGFIDSIPEGDREGFGDFTGKSVDEFVKHYKTLQDGKVVVPEAYETVESVEVKNQDSYDQLTKFCKDDLGLTQDQFTKLLPAMVQRDQAVYDEFQKSVTDMKEEELTKVLKESEEEAKAELTKEWGNDYEKKTTAASGLVAALADEEFVEYLTETGLGNDPRMLKAFYKLSTYISEDNFVEGKIVENDVRRDPATGAPMLKFKSMD